MHFLTYEIRCLKVVVFVLNCKKYVFIVKQRIHRASGLKAADTTV